ncbi:MAG: hypothetical protein ACE37F_20575 [Nannocystaceae bacterium]|nr:hypothetical protein [bacterium]
MSPSHFRELRRLLNDPTHNPFKTDARGIHYARFFTTGHDTLYFMVIYDEYWNAVHFLGKNAEGVDEIFGHCSGFPRGGAADAEALDRYLRDNFLCVELFYRAYDTRQSDIRDALVLRDNFLSFLRDSDGGTDADLRALYADFVDDPHLLNHDKSKTNDVPAALTAANRTFQLTPIRSPDRVGPFTLLARIKDKELKKVQRLLRLGTFATIDLGVRPLKNLPTLHFARVSVVDRNYMLFASVYDGDFIQYVEDFGTRIAKEIDKIFGSLVGYPMAGSRDIIAFKAFLRARQVKTNAFGGSYLDRSLLQIKSSLALSKALAEFTQSVGPSDRRLGAKLRHFLHDNQLLLT